MAHRDPTERAAYNKIYRSKNRDRLLRQNRAYYIEYRLKVLGHYSNGDLRCACCGEGTYEFLSLDHIRGGGNQHRKSLGSKYIYSFLIQCGYPEGYRVLCHNCNLAIAYYKVCPHQRALVGYKEELLKSQPVAEAVKSEGA